MMDSEKGQGILAKGCVCVRVREKIAYGDKTLGAAGRAKRLTAKGEGLKQKANIDLDPPPPAVEATQKRLGWDLDGSLGRSC